MYTQKREAKSGDEGGGGKQQQQKRTLVQQQKEMWKLERGLWKITEWAVEDNTRVGCGR